MNATTRSFNYDGWQALAQAAIKQAAEDWRTGQRRKRNKLTDTRENGQMIRECESYILSATETLTGANGHYIMRKLREEFS